ncbi:MAG: DUF4965 domain-containing protein [Ruminococcaceae bacterium]|nr:DUF4965 domain-containing protein [Oscillospiraceae bacterium]
MKLRVPAIPLIAIDPYFSVWAGKSLQTNTMHWSNKPNTTCVQVTIDGNTLHALGHKPEGLKAMPDMPVESIDMDAFSTIVTYKTDAIRLTLKFTSPLLVEDLYYASRPVSYCKCSYEGLDGKAHKVSVRFIMTEELVLAAKGEGRALANKVEIPEITAIKMGGGDQNILGRSGDDICIDWGYLYLAIKGEGEVGHIFFDGMYAISGEATLENEALFLFAFDDIYSIQYFKENLKAYWKKDGKTIEEAIIEAANDYDTLIEKCENFSNRVISEATAKGGEKYAELLTLAIRQVMAAHKLVVDKNGKNLYISKECWSDGCAATVDVTYPSAPMYLIYNTELLKGMLRPVMDYAYSAEWTPDYAPHDLGFYPLLNGQVYGVEYKPDGTVKIDHNMQMPVEECGNMIILFAAICDADNNTDFVAEHIDTLRTWCKYLIKYGLDPEHQLCTDDFAGHMAHNVNLSIKAIMGIAAYSRILSRLGINDEADDMMKTAREYAKSVVERAKNEDGSYRLAYDKPDSFSLKYNAVWDKIWKTSLFPEEFYKGEIERYKKETLPYGVPLDSREKYTKSDWLLWVATMAENSDDFNALVEPMWSAFNTMRTRVPMPDWYYCDTSDSCMFQNRTVQAGLFIRLMLD